ASAAYWIGSAADQVIATRDGGCGSIGVFALHLDQSKRDDQQGLKYTFVFAGDKKVDLSVHAPLSDRARADLATEVFRVRGQFVGTVARNRNATVQAILATEAGMFYGTNAIPLLADRVATCAEVRAMLRATLPAAPTYSLAPVAPAMLPGA